MSTKDTMPHVEGLLAAYALDAVYDDERAQVEKHLQECSRCVDELQTYAETTVWMSEGLQTAPPPRLRGRLLKQVAQEAAVVRPMRRTRRPAQWLAGVAAAGLIAAGGWGIWAALDEDLSPTQQVVQAADAVQHEASVDGHTLTVVTSQEQERAVLLSTDLPDLQDGQVYQAWFMRSDGAIDSAGVVPDPGADAELSGDPRGSTALALSVEPEGGSQQPSTEPIAQIPLQG